MPETLYNLSRYIPQVEAELLLCSLLKCTREELYADNLFIDDGALGLCDSLVQRRLSGEPLQYITGNARFMDMDFFVNKDTFIPRPETEILVKEVINCMEFQKIRRSISTMKPLPWRRRIINSTIHDYKILDLCTGCGNIAISLARSIPNAEIIATDISQLVLDVAELNSAIHGLGKKISFYQGDLFQALPIDKQYKFDIIVTNPPYIKTSELASLQKEVAFEPSLALDGGSDGLKFYRAIADAAMGYLNKDGSIFLEIGNGEAGGVKQIFKSKNIFKINKIIDDFAGIKRVIWISLL